MHRQSQYTYIFLQLSCIKLNKSCWVAKATQIIFGAKAGVRTRKNLIRATIYSRQAEHLQESSLQNDRPCYLWLRAVRFGCKNFKAMKIQLSPACEMPVTRSYQALLVSLSYLKPCYFTHGQSKKLNAGKATVGAEKWWLITQLCLIFHPPSILNLPTLLSQRCDIFSLFIIFRLFCHSFKDGESTQQNF